MLGKLRDLHSKASRKSFDPILGRPSNHHSDQRSAEAIFLLHSGTYSHVEHLEMLKVSLGLDPIRSTELIALTRQSFGESRDEIAKARDVSETSISSTLFQARERLCASTSAAAAYVGFALELLDDSKRLTPTDLRVLRMMASGMTPPQIAEALGYHGQSLRSKGYWRIKLLREKLGAKTNAEAIRLGVRFGLLNPENGDPPLPAWPD